MQAILHLIYPPACLSCREPTEQHGMLCGSCRAQTPFVTGLVCDQCGLPLPGETAERVLCDDCMAIARPWERGRAALLYKGRARAMVLAFKHGDRTDLARPMARWMLRASEPVLSAGMIVVPAPIHRLRLLRRRYNQAGLLARELAGIAGLQCAPDLLLRLRHTRTLEGLTRRERFAELTDAIGVRSDKARLIAGLPVLLVDDVMTSGATLAAAADALLAAGAGRVCVSVLARVGKDA